MTIFNPKLHIHKITDPDYLYKEPILWRVNDESCIRMWWTRRTGTWNLDYFPEYFMLLRSKKIKFERTCWCDDDDSRYHLKELVDSEGYQENTK